MSYFNKGEKIVNKYIILQIKRLQMDAIEQKLILISESLDRVSVSDENSVHDITQISTSTQDEHWEQCLAVADELLAVEFWRFQKKGWRIASTCYGKLNVSYLQHAFYQFASPLHYVTAYRSDC